MTWKQFLRRFNEIMADTSCTPLGVTDLEAWQQEQKNITERTFREAQEQAYLLAHWYEQDAYMNGTLFKRLWMRIQYTLMNIKGEGHHSKIPDYVIQEMARCLLPDLIAFYESEEGKAAFAQWKAEQDSKKKEQSKVA